MTTPPQRSARRAVVPLLRIVLAAQAMRIVVAVIAGVTAGSERLGGADFGNIARESGPERLLQFASGGDDVGLVLMLVAAVLLWLAAMLPRSERPWRGDYVATCWLLALTSISALLTAVGYLWLASNQQFFPAAQELQFVGLAVIYAATTAALLFVVRGVNDVVTATGSDDADADDSEVDAAVFAVDRKSGAVLAWPSRASAREKAPLYGVEDDEYEWFLDDGTVLQATVHGTAVRFTPTGDERPADLLAHLKAHAARRGLVVDDDEADEPLAYVDPIVRDYYLEMWPGWLRWLGRLTR